MEASPPSPLVIHAGQDNVPWVQWRDTSHPIDLTTLTSFTVRLYALFGCSLTGSDHVEDDDALSMHTNVPAHAIITILYRRYHPPHRQLLLLTMITLASSAAPSMV